MHDDEVKEFISMYTTRQYKLVRRLIDSSLTILLLAVPVLVVMYFNGKYDVVSMQAIYSIEENRVVYEVLYDKSKIIWLVIWVAFGVYIILTDCVFNIFYVQNEGSKIVFEGECIKYYLPEYTATKIKETYRIYNISTIKSVLLVGNSIVLRGKFKVLYANGRSVKLKFLAISDSFEQSKEMISLFKSFSVSKNEYSETIAELCSK